MQSTQNDYDRDSTSIFGEKIDEFFSYNNQTGTQYRKPKLGFIFDKSAITHLYERFVRMQKILFQHREKMNLTHADVFSFIDPVLSSFYEKVFTREEVSIETRFNLILNNLQNPGGFFISR